MGIKTENIIDKGLNAKTPENINLLKLFEILISIDKSMSLNKDGKNK